MGCGCRSDWPVCFVAINPCVLSANRVDLGFYCCFINFPFPSVFSSHPPPVSSTIPPQSRVFRVHVPRILHCNIQSEQISHSTKASRCVCSLYSCIFLHFFKQYFSHLLTVLTNIFVFLYFRKFPLSHPPPSSPSPFYVHHHAIANSVLGLPVMCLTIT